ncbi:MAG: hypothetical protein FWD27_06490, partial [Coriobacteriia bacterium]|nr:hypothetical protein [Coriobacteriia bacterium]
MGKDKHFGRMMGKLTKTSALLFSLLLLSSLFCGACTDARQAAGNGQSYEESIIPLPQEVSRVLFASRISDAPVTVIGANLDNSSIGMWELQHDNSWTQKLDAAKILSLSTDDFINCASIAPGGSLFFGVQSYFEGESMRLYIIDNDEAVDVKDFRLPL